MTPRLQALRLGVVGLAACTALAAGAATAETPSGPPNALQGFSQNRDKPVKIDAASLEVRDKDKIATFAGGVQVVQGDTTMRCKSLAVFYDQDGSASRTLTAAKPGPAGQQRIKRLEARGGVVVTQKDQTATGDTGIFDMAANTVTLNGNVVVTKGDNILKGDRLVVDLTSGVSKVEAGKGRVQGLFLPASGQANKLEFGAKGDDKSADKGSDKGGDKSTDKGARDAPRAKSARPSGLY